MTLTAVEIKTSLDSIVFDPPIKRINDYVAKNESRRIYPSIDIQNITGEEEIESVPTTTTKQIFLVHLYYRTRGTGAEQEPDIKAAEDLIFDKLDTLQTTTDNIQIVQSWDRKSEIFPVSRVRSTLRVTSEIISSDITDAILGTGVTIQFPSSPAGIIPVIDVLSDETGIIKDLDLTTGAHVYSKIRNSGLLSVLIAVSQSDEELIKTQVRDGNNLTLQYTKGGATESLTVNPVSIIASGVRGEVQTQIFTVDVIS